MTGSDNRVRRLRRRWLGIGAVVVAGTSAVAATAVVVGYQFRSPAQLAADAAPPEPSVVTAAVERRRLAEPVLLRGRVQPGASVKVYPPATAVGADNVVTKVHLKRDVRIREGQVLLERSGEPMFVLVSPFPLYRDIRAGMTGPDVIEVQRALNRLGHRVAVSAKFDSRTGRALADLYAEHGYTAPAMAEPPATLRTGAAPSLPRTHVLVLARAGQRVSSVNVRVGDVLTDPRSALFDLDRRAPSIVATARPEQASLLTVGQITTVTDDAAGTAAQARVETVGTRSVSADSGTGLEVRFRFTGKPVSTDGQRAVLLEVNAAGTSTPVLAVPVTAISSMADGSSYVTVADGADVRDVSVKTGRIAGGWVEILPSGHDLIAGSRVVVGERSATRQ